MMKFLIEKRLVVKEEENDHTIYTGNIKKCKILRGIKRGNKKIQGV